MMRNPVKTQPERARQDTESNPAGWSGTQFAAYLLILFCLLYFILHVLTPMVR